MFQGGFFIGRSLFHLKAIAIQIGAFTKLMLMIIARLSVLLVRCLN